MNVKVGDFGLAALLVTEREMEVKRRTTMCGTPNYLAPEILEKGKGHDEKVDLWAIGVIAYTLAVGKAPFHASTKEEIYKKLKSGSYNWPELATTTNQSADLRHLVASLLVPEEQRPPPDQIVSQNFFKIAFVPDRIPTSAREKAPVWPEVSVPSAETIRKGYSDTWFAICKQSGVGEYEEGRCFRLNGGKKVKSIVYDMTAEAQLGRQPTMPIPKDTVYVSPVSSWDAPPSGSSQLEESEEAVRPERRERGLKEIHHNEVGTVRPETVTRRAREVKEREARDAEMMPPPARPASRTGRTGTVRKAARTISEETAESKEKVRVPTDEPGGTLRVAKTRQAPATTTAAGLLREMNSSSTSSGARSARSQPTAPESEVERASTAKPTRAGTTTKRSADASLARRPRAATRTTATTKKERPVSPENPGPLATLDELKQVSPFKPRRRKAAAEADVIEILSDKEDDPKPAPQSEAPAPAALNLPPPPTMSRKLPVPGKPSRQRSQHNPHHHQSTATAPSTSISGTDPETVLHRLTTLRHNLSSALHNKTPLTSAPHLHEPPTLPFVSRWVDYSRKHGVGYVLSTGTVGCIINAAPAAPHKSPPKPATPVTHLFCRQGQRWLSRVGKDFSGLDAVPLEVLEDRGREGVGRKVYKGLGSVKEGPLAVEAERRRCLSVLWVKFGRYMCQSLDGEEKTTAGPTGLERGEEENFVRFYQRIGSVGVWAFADGCLQVHFPDHTKLVLSASGAHLSLTALSPEAAAYLSTHGELLPHHVSSREVHAASTASLLHEGGRIRQRVMRANQLALKLEWIGRVVGQWLGNEGLGRLDGDGDEMVDGLGDLEWRGLAVRDGARKMDRVTVGRYGGDDVGVRQAS